MARVSVLTAALDPDPGFLREAYESLHLQEADWQWVIQLDGPDTDAECIPPELAKDTRVCIAANGERLGTAATRNLGLLRCESELIQVLDADDAFYPHAIDQLAEAIEPEGVACAFGQSHRFWPDGRQEQWQPAPWPSGHIAAGTIGNTWLATGRHHITLSATLWKAVYVHAYGGWGALRGMEDVHLALPVSEDYTAAYVDQPVLRSRMHSRQATGLPALTGERELRHRALVASRLLAQRTLDALHRPLTQPVSDPDGRELPLPEHFHRR